MSNYYDEQGNEYILEDILDTEESFDITPDYCPECGSDMVWRNSSDFIQCDNCGYEEVPEDEIGECTRCSALTPEVMLTHGLCPVCADDMGVT
jgi:predicted RNA-binding Zn-ribbon protein involved in translation (DUF1610 family)